MDFDDIFIFYRIIRRLFDIFSLVLHDCTNCSARFQKFFELFFSCITLEHLCCYSVDLSVELSMRSTHRAMQMYIYSMRTHSCDLDRLLIGLALTLRTDIVGEDSFEDVLEEYVLHS